MGWNKFKKSSQACQMHWWPRAARGP